MTCGWCGEDCLSINNVGQCSSCENSDWGQPDFPDIVEEDE